MQGGINWETNDSGRCRPGKNEKNLINLCISTGYNTVNGYVARWTGIQPGEDGDFTVRVNAYPFDTTYYGYGPSVFMLAEEIGTDPTIIISGALTPFSSEPGTPSAEQSYTVAGSNLTENLVIAPPVDFEISLTSGSGFVSHPDTLPLTPSDGTVVH